MKIKLIIILVIILFQSCKTQQLQTKIAVPKIENQLKGELDYTKGGFELVQWQKNGDEITLGRIDEKGEIHFSLPEYDIQALGKNHMNSSLESQFIMIFCKGKGDYALTGQPLFKTPYDDVYSQLYLPMYVKKYGVFIAYVSLVSDEKMLVKGSYNKVIGSMYSWMYIDRALDYKDACIREANKDTDLEVERIADIQFKKGWNFIKRSLVEVQNYGENNEHTIPKKILFTLSTPKSEDVKWYLQQQLDDEKILAAKKEYELADPKTKKQDTTEIIYNTDSTTVKFEGIITNAKNDCWVDGVCSIEVNNKWWIAIEYGKRAPSFWKKERGLVTGIRFTKDNESIGKKVKVYAEIKKNNQLTLEGSKAYYVKIIE